MFAFKSHYSPRQGHQFVFPLRYELDSKAEMKGAVEFVETFVCVTCSDVPLHTFLPSKMHEPLLLRLLSILISVPPVTSTALA